jgi:hypothetical protein
VRYHSLIVNERYGIFANNSPEILFATLHTFEEREVRFGPVNASQAEAPPPTHGVLNSEMIYPFTNCLFGAWVHGKQGSEKRMMWFLDCYLERLAVQQILNEAVGGLPCLKAPRSDS